MARKPRIGDVVCVKWDDAKSWQQWIHPDTTHVGVGAATTYGFLIASNKAGVSISGTFMEGRRYSDCLDIPRGGIKSIRVVRRQKRQKGKG